MIARIEKINGSNRCSNCKMWQQYLNPVCPFCDSVFSNYEEVLIDFWEAEEQANKDFYLDSHFFQ